MAVGDKITTLEARVKEIIKQSADLKRRTTILEARLRESNARLLESKATVLRQADKARQWEQERDWIRGRLKHILGELELIQSDDHNDEGGRGEPNN